MGLIGFDWTDGFLGPFFPDFTLPLIQFVCNIITFNKHVDMRISVFYGIAMHKILNRALHIRFIICAMVMLALAQQSFARSGPEDHLTRGDAYFQSGDNRMALRDYDAAYKSRPSGFQELFRMSRVYNDLGRAALSNSDSSEFFYRQAIAFADSLYRHYPDTSVTQFMYALTYGSLLPFSGVRERVRIGKLVHDHALRALELDSTYTMAYVLLGIFEREASKLSWLEKGIVRIVFGQDIRGSLQQSELYFNTALQYEPKNIFASYELYWTFKEMGDHDRALASLSRALESQPHTAREILQYAEARDEVQRLTAAGR